jgi:hypothetical protein
MPKSWIGKEGFVLIWAVDKKVMGGAAAACRRVGW